MQDTYYQRSEVSNSDLTELKNLLYPRTQYGDKEKAFKFGSLIDAMITEPERVRYDKRMVDDILYSGEDWELAEAMKKSLRMEARHDPFLAQVLANDSWSIRTNVSNMATSNTRSIPGANGTGGFRPTDLGET